MNVCELHLYIVLLSFCLLASLLSGWLINHLVQWKELGALHMVSLTQSRSRFFSWLIDSAHSRQSWSSEGVSKTRRSSVGLCWVRVQ